MARGAAELTIRPAVRGDVPQLLAFIRELADLERLAHLVEVTDARLERALFGEHPVAEALVAEARGAVIGWALFVTNFSTFRGQPGFYIEDIYVQPEWRGCGAGTVLLRRIAAMAMERDYGRVEWAVLDWNEPAIRFYQQLGAMPLGEWQTYRLTGEALMKLAKQS
jgi:GNAT superfamily N-acetyltransferase